MVLANREQARELTLGSGIGLQRNRVVTRDGAQPLLKLGDHRSVADGLFDRRERMNTGKLRPADWLHLGCGVELHRAAPKRDHRSIQRKIAIRQGADVTHHVGFGVVLRELGVGQKV